jgi:peroxiredoxin
MAETNETSKKIEMGANVAVIIVALVAVAIFVRSYWMGPAELHHTITAGSKFELKAQGWRGTPKTVVLALSTNCHYCTESADFYRELSLQCHQRHIPIIAVLPQEVTASRSYLTDEGVTVDEIRKVQLSDLRVDGTPTLVIVDDGGVVKKVWVGKLSSSKEKEVLDQISL